MARGEGRAEGVAAGIMAGIGGGAAGAGAGTVTHRPLEEAFVKEEEGTGLKLRGFAPEDFGVVFDEVRAAVCICFVFSFVGDLRKNEPLDDAYYELTFLEVAGKTGDCVSVVLHELKK